MHIGAGLVAEHAVAAVPEDAESRKALAERFRYSQTIFQKDPWAERTSGDGAREFKPLAEVA